MKPEPLKEKWEVKSWKKMIDKLGNEQAMRQTKFMIDMVNDVKSACEFFLKYKDNSELLMKDFPQYRKEIESFKFIQNPYFEECSHGLEEGNCVNCIFRAFECCSRGEIIENEAFKENYNEWLFKLAFKDVMEDV